MIWSDKMPSSVNLVYKNASTCYTKFYYNPRNLIVLFIITTAASQSRRGMSKILQSTDSTLIVAWLRCGLEVKMTWIWGCCIYIWLEKGVFEFVRYLLIFVSLSMETNWHCFWKGKGFQFYEAYARFKSWCALYKWVTFLFILSTCL